MFDSLEKVGIEAIGAIVIAVGGWLGYKKVGNTVTKTDAETDVYQLLNQELVRVSTQLTQLSQSYGELQKTVFSEREDCSNRIAILTEKLNAMQSRMESDESLRQTEQVLRRAGKLQTRKTDTGDNDADA